MIELSEARSRTLRDCDERYPRQLAEMTHERDEAVRAAQRKYPPLLRQLKSEYDESSTKLDADHSQEMVEIESRFKVDWETFLQWARERESTVARRHRRDSDSIRSSLSRLE